MDVRPYLALEPTPAWVFDRLEERKSRVRFMLPTDSGDWTAVTWGAFADMTRKSACFLTSAGLDSQDRFAILSPNRVEWMAAALGGQAAGGAMVPIYPSSTADQVAYVVEHSDARFLFVDTVPLLERVFQAWERYEGVERIVLFDDAIDPAKVARDLRARGGSAPTSSAVERKIISWSRAMQLGSDFDREQAGAFERGLASVSLDQASVMLYTSGTSGAPKGVPLTHRNTNANTQDWLEVLAPLLDEQAVDLLWLPMSHIFGYGEACIGNMLGWTSYMSDPKTVLTRFSDVRPSVFMSVPSYWEKLAASAMAETEPAAKKRKLLEATGGRLKFCLSGGAGLKREIKEVFHQSGLLIIEGYGLTETGPTLTMNRPDSFRFDSVGKPFPSVELRFAEDGEILAKGPNVFAGYHKNPGATHEAFTDDGWFKTGDIGKLTDDGFIQIVDRKKDILVTAGGKNVPPANIEIRFRDDPFIEHLVVYGDGKKYLVAGVWLHRDVVAAHLRDNGLTGEAAEQATRRLIERRIEDVNSELASFETIKKFRIFDEPLTVESGFLTPTLKVKRKKVYEAFAPELERLYG